MALPTSRRRATGTIRAALAALAVSALLVGGAALPATADPTPSAEELAAARQQAVDAATSVAAMDVRIAQLTSTQEAAFNAVATAGEAYNQAVVDHAAAVSTATAATARSDEANVRAEASRVLLVGLARDSSRSGGGIDQLGMYLTATGIEDAVSTTDALSLVGSKADSAAQQYQADSVVATTLQDFADRSVADQEAKRQAADDAFAAAEDAQVAADQAVAAAATERQTLLVQLAEARSTSVEIEAARQAGLEAERAAAAEAAARARVAQAAPVPASPQDPALPVPSGSTPPVQSAAPPVPATPPVSAPPVAVPPVVAPPVAAPPVVPPPVAAPPVAAPPVVPPPVVQPPAVKPPGGGLLGTGTSRGSAAQGEAAVAWAKTRVGIPYGWGGTGPGSYDCSGLTGGAWSSAGLNLNRTSRDQYKQTLKISLDSLRPGDLVFWGNNPNDPNSITHVAIYAGGNQMVEASRPGVPVRVTAMRWDSRLMPYGGRP